jgi:hypothetical protein
LYSVTKWTNFKVLIQIEMLRLGLFCLLLVCFLSVRSFFYEAYPVFFIDAIADPAFSHLLTNFKKAELPYETGKIKPFVLHKEDSAFIKSAVQSKSLVAVTDPDAAIWDDADDEGKIRFEFPQLIGAGAYINIGKDIFLLELVDMYELKGESESNKQGIFSRMTFLCTFTREGKFINAVVSNYNLSDERGSLNRWSGTVNTAGEIIIKEYGARKEPKETYGFTTILKIMGDGKIVKIKSVKG